MPEVISLKKRGPEHSIPVRFLGLAGVALLPSPPRSPHPLIPVFYVGLPSEPMLLYRAGKE